MSNELINQSERISYYENIKINIGDYESKECGISYSFDAAGRRFANISKSSSVNKKNGETFEDAVERAAKKVRKALKKQEKRIRLASQEFVDFDTKEKL